MASFSIHCSILRHRKSKSRLLPEPTLTRTPPARTNNKDCSRSEERNKSNAPDKLMQKHFHATSEFTCYVVRESDDEVRKSSVASADTFESAISDSARSPLILYSSSFILPCQRAAFWCRCEFEMNAHAKRFLTINSGEGTACTCAPLRLEACASRPYRSACRTVSA